MELSGLKIKKVLTFSQKWFFYFGKSNPLAIKLKNFRRELYELEKKKTTLKKCLIFWEMDFSSHKLKKTFFFAKNNFSYNSGGNLQSLKIKKIRVFLKKKFFPNFTVTAA